MTEDVFTPEVVGRIARHMNDDHAEGSLLICQTLGQVPHAVAARMTGLDADGIDFAADTSAGVVGVRIPFAQRLTERAQVRLEVVRMYGEARRRRGDEDTGGHAT
jgi:putative heme iron utilization protein